MKFDKLVESILSENIAKKKVLKCVDCGSSGPDVKVVNCPYESDVYNTETKVALCKDCYQERANDI